MSLIHVGGLINCIPKSRKEDIHIRDVVFGGGLERRQLSCVEMRRGSVKCPSLKGGESEVACTIRGALETPAH